MRALRGGSRRLVRSAPVERRSGRGVAGGQPRHASRDGQQQADRQAAALQQFSAGVALQTQLANAQRLTALPVLAYVMPAVIPVVGLPLAFFVPPTRPH
jgi:hypothetical protein